MRSWTTFGARMSHGQTCIHKIHHDLDLGEATTFPLIILSMFGHGTNTQMSFCQGLLSESLEIFKIGILATLEAHTFACRSLIEVRSKEKL